MTTAPHQTANLEIAAGGVRVGFESSACRLPEIRGSEDGFFIIAGSLFSFRVVDWSQKVRLDMAFLLLRCAAFGALEGSLTETEN
jgi:hypothetical protein